MKIYNVILTSDTCCNGYEAFVFSYGNKKKAEEKLVEARIASIKDFTDCGAKEGELDIDYCETTYSVNDNEDYYYGRIEEEDIDVISEEDLTVTAANIMDVFEEILENNNVYIGDSEREGRDEESHLYGATYYYAEDEVKKLIKGAIDR